MYFFKNFLYIKYITTTPINETKTAHNELANKKIKKNIVKNKTIKYFDRFA